MMLEIDGSRGEGGGQIVRASVALSCLTDRPVRIYNIRARRKNPGLRAQHVSAVNLIKKIFDAEVHGLSIGSKEIVFFPSGRTQAGYYRMDIGTAGSITLVLQALSFALLGLKMKLKIDVTGGTDVPFAPTVDYFKHAYLALLSKLNYRAELTVLRRGYYPKGGGRVIFEFHGHDPEKLDLVDAGKIKKLAVFSSASSSLKPARVAERMARVASQVLAQETGIVPERHASYSQTSSDGCAICCVANTENSVLARDSLGKRGVPSEVVGKRCSQGLVSEINRGACVDKHMADHLVIMLALCGGKLRTSEVSMHTRTLVWLVSKFFKKRIKLDEKLSLLECE